MKRMIALLVMIVGTAVLIAPNLAQAAATHGTFKVVKGDVKVKSGKTGKLTPAKVGMKVHPKDAVITAKDSRAKVIMADTNVINISPETNIQIDKYEFDKKKGKKNVLLNVLSGKIRSKVNQKYDGKENKFQVKTPSAVAGVRGTDFLTGFNPSTSQTEVVTFEGEVSFGIPGANGEIKNPVPVKVGQMTTAQGGQPPAPPAMMPKSELAKLDQESNADTGGADEPNPRAPASEDGAKKEKDGKKTEGPQDPEAKKEDGPQDGQKKGPKAEEANSDSQGRARGPRAENERGTGEGRGPEDGPGNRDPAAEGDAASGPGAPNPEMEGDSLAGDMERSPDSQSPPPPAPGEDGMMPPPPEAGCEMCVEGDFPVSEEPIFTPLPEDTALLPPPPPDYDFIPDCGDFCRDVIESGNTNLIINVEQQ